MRFASETSGSLEAEFSDGTGATVGAGGGLICGVGFSCAIADEMASAILTGTVKIGRKIRLLMFSKEPKGGDATKKSFRCALTLSAHP